MAQSLHSVSALEVLGVLMYVPAPHVEAEVHPTAFVAVEYLPISQSVHCRAPPMEYFPAVQSSQIVSVLEVLGVLMYLPAPHADAAVHPTAP